jgi:hypothetical protein
MPTVPRLDSNQTVQQAPMPGVRYTTEAPLEAFGGGQSISNVFSAGQALAEEGQKIAAGEKKKADEIWAIGAKNALYATHTRLQDGPNGFLAKKGSDIQGLPNQVQKDWEDSVTQLREGANNDEQRQAVDQLATTQWHEVNHKLQEHVYVQGALFAKDTVEANIKLTRNRIPDYFGPDGSYDEAKIAQNIQEQKNAAAILAEQNGIKADSPIRKEQEAEIASKTHFEAVGNLLSSGRGEQAQNYFNDHLSEISGPDRIILKNQMEKEVALDKGMGLFATVKNDPSFKRPDGTLDEAKMENLVMNGKQYADLSNKQKLDLLTISKARVAEDYQNGRREDAGRERGFLNTIYTGIKQKNQDGSPNPVPLETALRIANQTGKDELERTLFADSVNKIYRGDRDHDPERYMKLWEDVQAGRGSVAEMRDAQQKGQITVSQREQLQKDDYNYRYGGINDLDKNKWVQLHNQIAEDYKNDRAGGKKVETLIRGVSAEKELSPEQAIELYGKERETNPQSGWHIPIVGARIPGTGELNIETDLRQSQHNTLEMAKIHNNVGRDQVSAIADGILRRQQTFGIQDLDAFAAQFPNGYKDMVKGSPVNNAIQSLMRDNRHPPVNKRNIDAVLKQHPDGNY